jgi:predicted nucleic acid-binding protein
MKKILLDSDVIIANLRNEAPVTEFLDGLSEKGVVLYVSPIAYAEIHAGRRPGEDEAIGSFFRSVECLPIDGPVGEKAGEYLRTFSKSAGVKIADALVAATAYCHQVGLYTLNRKHYPMKDIEMVGSLKAPH